MRCKRPIEAAGTQLAADKKCTTGIVGAKPRLSWAANGAALLRSLSLSLSLSGEEKSNPHRCLTGRSRPGRAGRPGNTEPPPLQREKKARPLVHAR